MPPPLFSAASTPQAMLGNVCWLMLHAPTHKHQFLADLEWLVLPPLMLRQFRLFMRGNVPFAWVNWGFLSEAVAQRLLSGQAHLKPEEWKSGDQAWIIDAVAPFGGVDGVLREVKGGVFPDRPLWARKEGGVSGRLEKVEVNLGKG